MISVSSLKQIQIMYLVSIYPLATSYVDIISNIYIRGSDNLIYNNINLQLNKHETF